jgi:hypothetical protein
VVARSSSAGLALRSCFTVPSRFSVWLLGQVSVKEVIRGSLIASSFTEGNSRCVHSPAQSTVSLILVTDHLSGLLVSLKSEIKVGSPVTTLNQLLFCVDVSYPVSFGDRALLISPAQYWMAVLPAKVA